MRLPALSGTSTRTFQSHVVQYLEREIDDDGDDEDDDDNDDNDDDDEDEDDDDVVLSHLKNVP